MDEGCLLPQSRSPRNWVFRGERPGKDGRPIKVRLFYTSQVTIQPHSKIKAEANRYDPAWEIYFEHRLGVKMADNLRERRKLLYLFLNKAGYVRSANKH